MEFNNRDTALEANLKNWQTPAPRAGFHDRIFDAATHNRPVVTRTMLVGKVAAAVVLMLGATLLAVYNQPQTAPQVAEVEKPVVKQVTKKQEPDMMAELPPISPVPESMATDGLLPNVNIYTALEASAVLTLPDVLSTPAETAPIIPVKAAAEASPTP